MTLEDFGKITVKVKQWAARPIAKPSQPDQLKILNPLMYPGFRRRWQQTLNAWLVSRSVNRSLGCRHQTEPRVAMTTLPIVADMVGRIDVDRWVYYCVDDFSVWPGLDGKVIDAMERRLVGKVDRIVAVSENLQSRLETMGRQSVLLSHGVDLDHWRFDRPAPTQNRTSTTTPHRTQSLPDWWPTAKRPILLFWGVVDRRLDTSCCLALAQHCGTLVLVGPEQSPDPRMTAAPGIRLPGPVSLADLPSLAAAADVLVMPYADLPVTRAMQPLKLKEYLATGKPAVVRKLPATVAWSQAADVVETPQQFVDAVIHRVGSGTPDVQHIARNRLRDESWDAKAARLEEVLFGPGSPSV